MKKLFTLLATVLVAITVSAQSLSFSEAAAKGTLNEKSFEADGVVLTLTDLNDKMSIDSNSAWFGTSTEDKVEFSYRLRTNGKSDSKNRMSLTIPADGTLKVYARTGSNNATDRNIVVTDAEGTEVINHILLETECIEEAYTDEEGAEKTRKIYAPLSAEVTAGTYTITYPVNSVNIYGFELVTAGGEKVEVEGCIYRLGIGDYIKGKVIGEKNAAGVMEYSIPEWYGPGSNTLKFTLSEAGQMTIDASIRQVDNTGYTYYYTGLQSPVNYICGWPGYDTSAVYDHDAVNAGNYQGIGEIKNDSKFYIYMAGYYGPYDKDGYNVTDPNKYNYWTFDTDMTDYENYTAISDVTATSAKPSVVKTPNYIIKNGVKYNYAGQRLK